MLANVIGVCVDTRQPYVIVEFIDGEALRDIIRRSTRDRSCSWIQRIKVVSFSDCLLAGLRSLAVVPFPSLDLLCGTVCRLNFGSSTVVLHFVDG